MPRPLLPDTLPGVLRETNSTLARLGGGSGLLEIGDPTGPPVVTGLILSSDTTRDAYGRDTANVTAAWNPIVTDTSENADPSQAPVKDYLVGFSTNVGVSWSRDASTEATAAVIHGLPVGKRIDVRVRARTTTGVMGPYASAFIVGAKDTTAPSQLSAPVMSGVLAGVELKWDGTVVGGGIPEDDTRLIEVYIGTESTVAGLTGNAANYRGTMGVTERAYTLPTREYGTTYYGCLRLTDRSNNKGPFSAISNGAKPGQVITPDLREDVEVKARAAGTFGGGNGVLNSSFEANTPTAPDGNGNATGGGPDPFRHYTQVVSADWHTSSPFHKGRVARLNRGSGNVAYVQSNGIPVAESTPCVVSAWVRLASAGLTPRVDCYATSGAQPTLADTPVPTGFALDTSKVGVWQRIAVAYKAQPKGGTVHCRVVLDSGPNGTVDVDGLQYELGDYVTAYAPNVEELLPGSIGPTEIAPGSVTSEKIIAGAIVAGKIQANAVGANELRAGSINSGKAYIAEGTILSAMIGLGQIDEARIGQAQITSAHIRELTAERITTGTLRASTQIIAGDPFGSRVVLDYDGLRLITRRFGYDEVTVALDRATGTGRFTGDISGSTIRGSNLTTEQFPGAGGNYIILSDQGSNRDKIQFVRGDQGQYVASTITSVYAGLVLDGSDPGGGAGRVVIGSNNSDQIIAFARRLSRFDTHVRAGLVNVAVSASGTAVPWPGGSFPNGVIPDIVSVEVVDPEREGGSGGAVFANVSNVSQSGCTITLANGAGRVSASRQMRISAEALLFA